MSDETQNSNVGEATAKRIDLGHSTDAIPTAALNPRQPSKVTRLLPSPTRWLSVLLLSNLLFLFYAAYRFWRVRMLPPPFFYNPNDTFMDFFNTTFWAFDEKRYESWKSIYPLFTFLIGRLMGSNSCASTTALEMRDCEFGSVWPLFVIYALGIGLSAQLYIKSLNRIEISQPKLFALTFAAFLLSLPGLFALERGNYIIIAFGFLALSAYWQKDWRGAVALALAVNLKQYLIVFWLIGLLKKRFGWIAISVSAALAINWLAVLLVPNVHYELLVKNMVGFATVSLLYFDKVWYPSSLSAWSRTLAAAPNVVAGLSDNQFELAKAAVNAARYLSVAASAILMVALGVRARRLEYSYLAFSVLTCLLVLTDGLGGYAIMFLLPFCGSLVNRPQLRWYPWILFALLMPLDVSIGPSRIFPSTNYFTGEIGIGRASLTLVSYLRPLVLAGLIGYLLRDVLLMPKLELQRSANRQPEKSG